MIHDEATIHNLMVDLYLHAPLLEHRLKDATKMLLALTEGLVWVGKDFDAIGVHRHE